MNARPMKCSRRSSPRRRIAIGFIVLAVLLLHAGAQATGSVPDISAAVARNACVPIPRQPAWRLTIRSNSKEERLIEEIASFSPGTGDAFPVVLIEPATPYSIIQPALSALSRRTPKTQIQLNDHCVAVVRLRPPEHKSLTTLVSISKSGTTLRVNGLAFSARPPLPCAPKDACTGRLELASSLKEIRQLYGTDLVIFISGDDTKAAAPPWRYVAQAIAAAIQANEEPGRDDTAVILGTAPENVRHWAEEAQVLDSDGYPKGEGKHFANLATEAVMGYPSPRTRREIFRAIILQHHAEILACYSKALDQNPALEGKVVVRWSLESPDGDPNAADAATSGAKTDSRGYRLFRARNVRIEATTLNNRQVEDCLVEQFASLRFPVFKTGELDVKWPLTFHAGTIETSSP